MKVKTYSPDGLPMSAHFLWLAGGPCSAPGTTSRKEQVLRNVRLAIVYRDSWQVCNEQKVQMARSNSFLRRNHFYFSLPFFLLFFLYPYHFHNQSGCSQPGATSCLQIYSGMRRGTHLNWLSRGREEKVLTSLTWEGDDWTYLGI